MALNLTREKSSFEVSINSTFQDNSILADDEHANVTPRTIWSIVLLLNLAVFIGTKFALLKLTLTVRSVMKNPQDTLFFIDEMEKLIVTPICTAIIVYDLFNNKEPPFSNNIPNCGIRILPLLLPNIMFFGGCAIALMRYIAIKYPHIIAKWSEVKIMLAVLFSWQTALIGNTYLMAVNSLDEYKSRCYNKKESSISFPPGPIFLFACGTEFAIYISICQYIYKSDIEVRQLISIESFRMRKRKNAVNVFGYIVHFLLELLVLVLGSILRLKMEVPLRIWYLFTSTLLALSMLLLSKPMKVMLTQLFMNLQKKSRMHISNDLTLTKPKQIEHNASIGLEMGSILKKK